MNLIKWILGAVAVVICVFTGYKLSEKYKLRRAFFAQFLAFNRKMRDEVSFTKNTLPNILKSGGYSGQFGKFIADFSVFLAGGKESEYKYLWFLTDEERGFLLDYFKSLGKTDAKSQLDFLKLCEEKLNAVATKAESEEKKYRTLYLKMGFLTGLLILVLIM